MLQRYTYINPRCFISIFESRSRDTNQIWINFIRKVRGNSKQRIYYFHRDLNQTVHCVWSHTQNRHNIRQEHNHRTILFLHSHFFICINKKKRNNFSFEVRAKLASTEITHCHGWVKRKIASIKGRSPRHRAASLAASKRKLRGGARGSDSTKVANISSAATRFAEGRNRNPRFPGWAGFKFTAPARGGTRGGVAGRRPGEFVIEISGSRTNEKERERKRERENKPRCFRGRGELVGPARPVYDSGMTLVEPARAARSEAQPKRGVADSRNSPPRVFSHGRPENIARCRLRIHRSPPSPPARRAILWYMLFLASIQTSRNDPWCLNRWTVAQLRPRSYAFCSSGIFLIWIGRFWGFRDTVVVSSSLFSFVIILAVHSSKLSSL
mgnify:CR=1 FL=1